MNRGMLKMNCNYCKSTKLEYLLSDTNERSLKIEVTQENGSILLIINNIRVFKTDFKYDFLKKDVYYLENIISELVQDSYNFNLSKVDIIVSE